MMNVFNYDNKGQLLNSTWGTPNYTAKKFTTQPNVNTERGLTYDEHGNIKTLQRTGASGNLIHNFTYNYQTNTNKLTSVPGYATYTYDAIGQLASEVKGGTGMYLDYDVFGQVIKIYNNAAKTQIMLSFVYDDGGNRIMKKDHRNNAVTWYSYDTGGTLLAVFDNNGTAGAPRLIEQPVYGTERLGTFHRPGNNYQYILTDHLGNTRVVINRNKLSNGNADVVYYADYYPFGSVIQSAGIPSRYGYQGEYSEKDNETGWNNFYLRNYDPAIGRWLSTDPYGQYWSPYVGMGNNPITGYDPDGGWSLGGDPDKPAYRVLLDEVVVTAKSSWKWAANSFNNVNWAQQWDSFQSGMPLWGTSRQFGGAMNKGDYLGAIGHLGTTFAEASTLALGTLWQKPAQFALTRTSTAIVDDAAKTGLKYSDDFLKAAQQAYPKLAGKTQLHHITPKYLGGPANGPLIKLDAAYHQQITNEF